MSDPVLFETDGAIATITLNRPETRNALDQDVIEAIESICAGINRNIDIRVAIVTGAGPGFSSGGNVKDMRDRQGLFGGSPAKMRDNYRNGIQRIPLALYRIEVPTIAAVNGPAIGAGLDLSLMCDMRIAGESAVFAESFVKVGIIPGDGGAWLLPRAISLSRACEMAFTGDRINAQLALQYGLVSQVVPDGKLIDAAMALAHRVSVNPPEVLRMTKSLIREGQRVGLDTLLELSAAMQAVAQHTKDHREAISAMFEKRSPVFTGER